MQSEFSFIECTPATAFLFPGQGSQQVGMGLDLIDIFPSARQTFEEADELLGFGLSQLCFYGPESELTETINVQPALLTVCVAFLRAIAGELGQRDDRRGRPLGAADGSSVVGDPSSPPASSGASFVAGHSLGEYTALVAAGSLSFADGLRLVRERGRLMKEAGDRQPGMMAAVLGLDEGQVAAICAEATQNGGIAQVANDNCPGQVVISGDRQGMKAAMAALTAAGARRVVPLAVSVASHSPLMHSASAALRQTIEATSLAPPTVPLIANTTAQPISDGASIRAELAAQLTGSVRWTQSMQFLLAAGITRFVEIGPGDVLSGLMRRIDRNTQRQIVNTAESVQGFISSLSGK
jgi:[acyl-carrier-protein] S-malonyltransferase